MKKLLLSVTLLCSAAVAQPPSAIPTGLGGPAYQSAVNAWMQYLYNGKQATITAGTTAQYYRGDKTWATLSTGVLAAMSGLYESPLTFSATFTRSTNAISLTECADGEILKYRTSTGWGCEADATGEAGGGITSLGGLTGSTQTFARVNDTNATLTIGSASTTHTFTLGWTGTLAIARGGTGAATTSQNFAFIGPTSGSGAPSFRALVANDIPTLNQNTTGTAANLSGTPALPNGTTATTQTAADNSTKLATTAYADTAAGARAPANAAYLTKTAESGLSAEANLGALTTGLLKISVSAGTATPSTAAAGTDYEAALGNPGVDGYVLKSTAAGVRSWEALGAGHTQNTDTGTTQATFQIDSGNSGPKLKNNAGVLEARNAADDDYADFRAKTLIAGDGTVAGEAVMNELLANGTNYISWFVPDSITNTLRLKIPNASPSAGDSMLFGAPSSNISTISFGKPAALAANGANCSASQIPLGVDASGAVEGCYQPQISTLSDAASVVTPSSSNTLTNKTVDAEGTGNSITIPTTVWLPGGGCNNATASSFWDLPASTPAVPACVTGTNTQKGVLGFADTSGGFSAQNEYLLPDDFTGAIDAKIIWSTSATSGNAKWSLSTICTAVGATETDDAAFNTASTVTTAAPGTANRLQTSAITSLTATGCAAGEFLHVKIFRDGNDGSDTIAATANLIGVELKIRRAM